jgi:iron-sulfur cluster repair protein YtfE (RIC family)
MAEPFIPIHHFKKRNRLPPFGLGIVTGVALTVARKIAMQMTTAIAGDWRRQLEAEHRLALALFDIGAKTKPEQTARRTAVLAKLSYALVKHGLQEEMVIYPAARQHGSSTSAQHLAAEHFDIKTYLRRLADMSKGDPQWIRIWTEFQQLVSGHIAEEEQVFFPRLHAQMTPDQNRSLTWAMNRQGLKLA